ncbi:SDR family NAD(P)-dependent oxidoreductase [Treponema primitia]|uniref:SDR family NAD(P)-dependent oxidoreductase n=1 Tax=Treponema primitia TaxID=88058 RepID=UPI000255522C|nr:SDR family NAD(P)-dependent oxidoreductase [Treponema primitia]
MSFDGHLILAPLIRGIWINASGESRVVVPSAGVPCKDPDRIVSADLSAAGTTDGLDEALALKALKEAYSAWVVQKGNVKTQPSCIRVKTPSNEEVVYWIDRDLASARKRSENGDGSPLELQSKGTSGSGIAAAGASASGRSDVVKNKIVLVTGGAQGFGEEIVRGLAASGALVFIADLNQAGAEKLAETLNAAEKRIAAVAVPVNVADEASVETLFKAIAKTAGGLDLCVSNAGVVKAGSVLEQDLAAFKFVTDINYSGFFLMAKHCGRLLRRQNLAAPGWKTDIIQINSKSGLEGSNKNGAYAGGKFGAIGLVESFALELVAYGIKVNAICPGNFLDGPLWADPEKGLFVQYLKAGKVPGAKTVADVRASYESKVPMGRGCTGADVMRAIYYIVEQEYETGQAVPVTGGQVMLH